MRTVARGSASCALQITLLATLSTCSYCFLNAPAPLAGLRTASVLRRCPAQGSSMCMAASPADTVGLSGEISENREASGSQKRKLPGLISAVILGVMSFRGPALTGPRAVHAAEPPAVPSAPMSTASTENAGLMTRHGEVMMVTDAKKAAEPNIMLSFKTESEKQLMTYLVSGAYVCVWAFFYFTHDSGESSE